MFKTKRRLNLSEPERMTLEQARDHHPKPYMREKASALLRIASGQSPYRVAVVGILKRRKPDTIYDWLNAYEQKGIAGLYQPARYKRDFSP